MLDLEKDGAARRDALAKIIEQLKIDDTIKSVAIAGRPGTGKTTLARELQEAIGGCLVHTDDYIKNFPFAEAAVNLIKLCQTIEGRYIVEGVQVVRMLRTGEREHTWQPDAVIFCEASTPVAKKHVSLAALTRSATADWLATHPKMRMVYTTRF